MKNLNKNIEIQPFISFERFCGLVNDIAEMVFDSNGDYRPEMYEYVFRVMVSSCYANYGADMPATDFLKQLYCEGWMEELRAKINCKQLANLEWAVNEKIRRMNEKSPFVPFAEALTELVKEFNNKMSGSLEDMMQIANKLKENNIDAESIVKAYLERNK